MSDQAKFKKMLEILLYINGRYGRSIQEIARRFEISERTAYRYLDTFEQVGFVITKRNEYRRIDPFNDYTKELNQLLHFSEEEAFILGKAIHQVSSNDPLREKLVKKLYALYDFNRVANTIIKPEETDKVHTLLKAVQEQRQVILKRYRSGSSGTTRDRHVEPFDFTTNYTGVACFDIEDQRTKLFKTSRISDVQLLDSAWEFRPQHQELKLDVFRHLMTDSIPVHLTMTLLAKNLLTEEFPLSHEFINKVGDHSYEFKGEVGNLLGVGRFVLGLPGEINVLGGEELLRYVGEKGRKTKNEELTTKE